MNTRYHSGEIEVQERAGVRSMAERIGNSIHSTIAPAAREFLEEQYVVVVGSVGADRWVWASLLAGKMGFVRVLDERTVKIDAAPFPGDPLAEALQGAHTEIGMLAIDFATRTRLRLNGEAERRPDGIHVRARQVYANCPKYIQAREPEIGDVGPGLQDPHVLRSRGLTDEQRALISHTDTFFIASAHPDGAADASHRGGDPGFVRFLGEDTLEFPDYSGNTMFNTLGNIAVNPRVGLLFLDFERGGTLQLTGEARIVWDAGRASRFAGAERVVEFGVREGVEARGAVPLRWQFEGGYSPFNPTWISLNVIAWARHWDPYPFILLNLALSFQAAYSAPVIMMSQNRQESKDRLLTELDNETNLKAEMEIEEIHRKVEELLDAQKRQAALLQRLAPSGDASDDTPPSPLSGS